MFIFERWTFLVQKLTRNLKIIGRQSENNFLMMSFFKLYVQVRLWKIKFWFIFAHFYVPLLISNTIFWIHQLHWMQKFWNIHQKVIYDAISGKFLRHFMIKPLTMYHQCCFEKISQQAKYKSEISNIIKRDVKI